jgi:hypothetical protein
MPWQLNKTTVSNKKKNMVVKIFIKSKWEIPLASTIGIRASVGRGRMLNPHASPIFFFCFVGVRFYRQLGNVTGINNEYTKIITLKAK